jgi:hypothetical protein
VYVTQLCVCRQYCTVEQVALEEEDAFLGLEALPWRVTPF